MTAPIVVIFITNQNRKYLQQLFILHNLKPVFSKTVNGVIIGINRSG